MNIKCFILGHLPKTDMVHDFEECHYCGILMWEYGREYETSFSFNLAETYYRIIHGFKVQYFGMNNRPVRHCFHCGKLDYFLRWRIGNHAECDDIPF